MKIIYVVDDQKEITDLLARFLMKENYEVKGFYDGFSLLQAMEGLQPDLVLLDIHMPKLDGVEILKLINEKYPSVKVVIITAYPENDKAEFLFKLGATDFISKPFKLNDILTTLKSIIQDNKSEESNNSKRIIGRNIEIVKCLNTALKVSNTSSPVLILGESGTGKEMIADYIHYKGIRKYKKLVKINCPSIPMELLEGELFGYEKGAFTGAINSKSGKIEEANGGTLFLDEVSELNLSLQTKLLRVLEYKTFERLGSNSTISSDFRLLCATNVDLFDAVKKGKFREDLYYRISGITIRLPSLRNRKEDIETLINFFLESFKENYITHVSGISPDALDVLKNYSWPGNIRELKNIIEMVASLAKTSVITINELPAYIRENNDITTTKSIEESYNLELIEREYIIKVLAKVGFSKKKAAALLGISERTLYNKIQKYNVL